MIPGLPAHILFMCVRYADSLNDANMLKSLMNCAINGIKQVVKVGTTFDVALGIMATLGLLAEMPTCPCFSDPSFPVFGQPCDSSNPSEPQSVKEAKLLGKDNLGQRAQRVGIFQCTSNPYLQDYSLVATTPSLLSP